MATSYVWMTQALRVHEQSQAGTMSLYYWFHVTVAQAL